MAEYTKKNFLDYEGLQRYDELIKKSIPKKLSELENDEEYKKSEVLIVKAQIIKDEDEDELMFNPTARKILDINLNLSVDVSVEEIYEAACDGKIVQMVLLDNNCIFNLTTFYKDVEDNGDVSYIIQFDMYNHNLFISDDFISGARCIHGYDNSWTFFYIGKPSRTFFVRLYYEDGKLTSDTTAKEIYEAYKNYRYKDFYFTTDDSHTLIPLSYVDEDKAIFSQVFSSLNYPEVVKQKLENTSARNYNGLLSLTYIIYNSKNSYGYNWDYQLDYLQFPNDEESQNSMYQLFQMSYNNY